MTITIEQFTDAMKLAVLQRGADYVYPKVPMTAMDDALGAGGCFYRVDGKPSCIIGTALDILGLQTTSGHEGSSAFVVLNLLGIEDGLIRNGADVAQGIQDCGRSWGEALREYLRYLETMGNVDAEDFILDEAQEPVTV